MICFFLPNYLTYQILLFSTAVTVAVVVTGAVTADGAANITFTAGIFIDVLLLLLLLLFSLLLTAKTLNEDCKKKGSQVRGK